MITFENKYLFLKDGSLVEHFFCNDIIDTKGEITEEFILKKSNWISDLVLLKKHFQRIGYKF